MNRHSWSARLPGPSPTPIVGWRGNVIRFLLDPIAYIDPLARGGPTLQALCPGMRGGLFHARGVGAVIAIGPPNNHAVLSKSNTFHSVPLQGPVGCRAYSRVMAGIFGMNGERHRQQRRLLMPPFLRKHIEGHRDHIVDITDRMLAQFAIGQTRDLLRDMQELTLRIASRVLFGCSDTGGSLSVGRNIQRLVQLSLSPRARLPAGVPGSTQGAICALAERVEQDLRALCALGRTQDGIDQASVLALLLRSHDQDDGGSGSGLSDDELIGHCFALFLAGHETTMSALCWTLFLLSQHSACEQGLREELAGALRGDAATAESIGGLRLLDQVIKESLRLLPPAPLIPRIVGEPTRIADCELPADAEVVLSVYHTHRMPDLYAQPRHFLPARWETLSPSPYEYLPFGAGARMCLGAALATFEIKIILSMLLQRFRLVLTPGAHVRRTTAIVMAPGRALPMRVASPRLYDAPSLSRDALRTCDIAEPIAPKKGVSGA